MEGTALRNRWRVYPDDVVVWRSELPDLDDDRLGAWSGAVLAAGTETEVLIPITPVPEGPLPFAGVMRTATRLAYANSDGDVVEGKVADMADLVAAVSTPSARVHERALNVMSLRPVYGGVSTSVGIPTDIWLPQTSPFEYGMGPDDLVDNSMLAAIHTPRLNAFFAAVRTATEEAGGTWSLDRERTLERFLPLVDDAGVLLD
jgi:hypothetical protein